MYFVFKLAKIIAVLITSIAAIIAILAGIMQIFEKKPSNHKPYGIYEKWIKRPLDAFLSTGALIVFSPILLVTAVLVKIKLGSPVLFIQERPGRNEKIFKLYKFRTMTDDRDKNGVLLTDDERLTSFGKALRKTSLDELPELINIITGDMAVIGPRPLLIEYLPYYTEEEHHRHDVRPGLTGLAQVNGRNATTWENKFLCDIRYVNNISFLGDLRIIKETIYKVIHKTDILVGKEITAGRLDAVRKKEVK